LLKPVDCPVGGERWWKKENVVMEFVNQFLIPEKQNPNWKKGIPHSWVKKEWHTTLLIIHRYITCEGRFSLVYLYHIRLLIHINGDYPLNLPYFLLKSLSKMSKRVQSHPATAKGSLFHQGLIKTLVISSLNEVQRPWDWLIQSLRNDLQSAKSKNSKGKKSSQQKQTGKATEFLIKEESPAARVTRASKRKLQTQQTIGDFPVGKDHEEATTSRGKKSKPDEDIDIFLNPEIKMEIDEDEDYTMNPVQSPVKQKQKSTSKKSAKGKKQSKKPTPVPKFPRRNSTRAVNKFRLNSKAMFDPSIKKENLIIIEDNSEDSKTGIKKQAETPSLHRTEKESENLRKRQEKGKQVAQYSRRPVTRETTRSTSKSESVFRGTGVVSDDKDDPFAEPDQIPDLPETRDSDSTEDEDHSSGLSSRYRIKLRKPQAAIDLNLPAPVEEYPEFKVKVRNEKDRIKELQGMVKQLKKEKALVEQWNARQQEKIQDFKKKRKEQKTLLKELRESNFRLYWHNIVLTTKLKQRDTKASAVIIP
jgi:hypothetical protein